MPLVRRNILFLLIHVLLFSANAFALDAVDIAINQIGDAYEWAGNGPDVFDCSGLTSYSYRQVGVDLPRTVLMQSQVGELVVGELQRGDLVFFETDDSLPDVPTHVGIYEGNNILINANSVANQVKRNDISTAYWIQRFLFARRISPEPEPTVWGFEAAFGNARILEYDLALKENVGSFVPATSGNGRGIAFDPTDGNLWYAVVGFFAGDGTIRKVAPTGGANLVTLPVIGALQGDFGALDIDPDDPNFIWVAGYQPVNNTSYFYKVRTDTGVVVHTCSMPFQGGGAGNDTLAVTTIQGVGKVLLTDAGEVLSTLFALNVDTCAIVTFYNLPVGVTGIDVDSTGNLIATDLETFFDLGPAPYTTIRAFFSTSPSFNLEDITLAE